MHTLSMYYPARMDTQLSHCTCAQCRRSPGDREAVATLLLRSQRT